MSWAGRRRGRRLRGRRRGRCWVGRWTSGQKGSLMMGAVTSGAPSYTTAQSSPLSLTTGGLLRTSVGDPLPAGSNVIGHVIADTGSTTAVTALPALPAGSNVIGHV